MRVAIRKATREVDRRGVHVVQFGRGLDANVCAADGDEVAFLDSALHLLRLELVSLAEGHHAPVARWSRGGTLPVSSASLLIIPVRVLIDLYMFLVVII